MKKGVIHFVQYVLVKILFFGAAYPLQAQVSNPSSWESFVGSDENRLVSDTLRLQTFGDSEWDNWGYTLTVNSSLIQEKHTIKIPVGSGIIFSPFSLNNYTNVKIVSHIAGLKLEPGELLLFNVHRNNSDEVITGNTPEQGKDYMGYRYLTIGSNPSSFAITTNKKVNTQNGYYMTDSVFAYGDIPSYSLFSGIGNWNDTTLWSHLPPLRHRNALIKGNVTITTDTYCKDIAIHSGSLEINPGNLFILQNLDLYETKPLSIQEGRYFFPAVSPSIKLLKNPANGILSHFLSTFIRLASTSTSNKRMLRLTTEATIFMSNPTTETSGHRPTNLPGIGKSCPSVPIMSPCSRKTKVT